MNGKQLKNSILQWAIQGKLVPQDPNDEPASVLLEKIRAEKARLVKEGKLKKKDLEVKPIAEEEIPFEIPESWEWCRLKELVMFIGGYAFDSQSFISSSEYQVLRLGNIKNDLILLDVNPVFIPQELAESTQRFKCKLGDILITMTGTRKKRDYFYSVLIGEKQKDLFVNQRVGCLRAYEKQVSNWLIKAIKTETVLQEVFQYETGTANQGNLGAENILNVLVPLPPLAEQHRIVAKIEELMPLVEKYGAAQETLDEWNQALPEKLKKSILQEAIQGKLVPQDPADEPASALLERIREEKKRLAKEGKLKKKDLEVKPIEEEGIPFEIPESWEWCRLNTLMNIFTGKKDANFGDEKGKYDFFTCSNTPIKSLTYSYDGDYLIMPGNGANIGQVIHYYGKFEAYQRTYLLQAYGTLDLDYLKYHLMSNWKEYNQDKLYGSAIPYIKLGNLTSYLVALPPLAEQRRIVAKIEELFGVIKQ